MLAVNVPPRSRYETTALRVSLALLFVLSLFLRTYQLGAYGVNEDEANKMLATISYRNGDFSANAEHPMFMKLLSTASVLISEKWNSVSPWTISPEAALRFPLAFGGAAATIAVYCLGRELLNPACALLAAALWAVDINSVALSRIAKEDSLVTLFFILGNFFLLRGKRLHFDHPKQTNQSYMACGASYGLLFATKYLIPLPWIALIYYDIFRFRREPRWRISRAMLFSFYACFFAAFVLLNPAILNPHIWEYMWNHFTHKRLTHHGYFMMNEIYINDAWYTFWGVPFYYYALYIFIKTPLPLLGFLVTGAVYALRRFRDDRFLFLSLYFFVWLFLLSLPGGKFTRYMITLLPAIVLLQSLGIYLCYTAVRSHLIKRGAAVRWQYAFGVVLLVSTVGWHLYLNFRYLPAPSMYLSVQGGGEQKEGYYFPQDDFYDAGLREAFAFIARTAPTGATVLASTPAVFDYYTRIYSRSDLRFLSMADRELRLGIREDLYVVAQDYRTYFENFDILTFVYSQLNPLFVSTVRGKTSVAVYVLSSQRRYARHPFCKAMHWPGNLRGICGSRINTQTQRSQR